jgi:hypothetical protein
MSQWRFCADLDRDYTAIYLYQRHADCHRITGFDNHNSGPGLRSVVDGFVLRRLCQRLDLYTDDGIAERHDCSECRPMSEWRNGADITDNHAAIYLQ